MSDIPPKHTPGPGPFGDAEGQPRETGVVAMYNAASNAGAEPFPVLKAFQDYIEAERAQARKRIAYLSVIFCLVIVLVVAGFFVIGLSMFNNMSSLQARLLEAALRPQQQPAPQPVQPAAVVVQPAQPPQQPPVATLPPEVSRKLESLTAMAETAKKDREDELARLREQMLAVQKQNEAMQRQIAKERAEREERDRKPHYNERGVLVLPKPNPAPAYPVRPPPLPPADDTPAPAVASSSKPAPVAAPAAAPSAKPAPAVAPVSKHAQTAAAAPASKPAQTAAAAPVAAPSAKPAQTAAAAPAASRKAPAPPAGMVETTVPVKMKNVGAVPWRLMVYE